MGLDSETTVGSEVLCDSRAWAWRARRIKTKTEEKRDH
jgi:hypothetical protein